MSMGPRNWLTRLIPIGPTFQLNDDDIVVFVVGPTGSGKSTFVHAVTKALGLEVGKSLRVATKKVQPIRCELTEEARIALGADERKYIVFVDTPSFHTDDKAHSKAVKEMTSWLEKSKAKSTRFGTIYMHRSEDNPTKDPIQDHLDTFALTCPEDYVARAFPMRLHCVFSCVDKVQEKKISDHKDEFAKQLSNLQPKIVHGSRLKWNTSTHPDLFIKGDSPTAWNAVEQLFSP